MGFVVPGMRVIGEQSNGPQQQLRLHCGIISLGQFPPIRASGTHSWSMFLVSLSSL